MIEWLDAHTHLDSDELYPQKDEVLRRASTAGVRKILLVNSEASAESFQKTIDCLNVKSEIERYLAFGIHPHHASLYSDELEKELLTCLEEKRVIAFGEIGLDFYYDFSPRDVQIKTLKRQLRLALDRKLPVVIHCRDAYGLLTEILSAASDRWNGLIHCFTGTPAEAEKLLELGFFISFSGIVTFLNAHVLRDSALHVPVNHILVETDAPYLAPAPVRGKTNEPAFVVHTAEFLANLKSIEPAQFSQQLFRNFASLFAV